MKKFLTKMVSLVLVFVCCLTLVFPVSASGKDKVKITYKGKSLTVTGSPIKGTSYSKVKKAWGTANKKKKIDSTTDVYTYKKGESNIEVYVVRKTKRVIEMNCEFFNKGMKVDGIYIGMSKSAALKILKKYYGKSNVYHFKGEYEAAINNENGIVAFEFNSKGKVISIFERTFDRG